MNSKTCWEGIVSDEDAELIIDATASSIATTRLVVELEMTWRTSVSEGEGCVMRYTLSSTLRQSETVVEPKGE
jgi:hypothetical protein